MSRTRSPRPRARRLIGLGTACCLAVGSVLAVVGLVGPAQAAPKSTVTVTATVSGSSADIHVDVAFPTSAVKSAACTLDGASTPCGPATTTSKKSSSYDVQATGLAQGSHSFTISIRLGANQQGNDNSNNQRLSGSASFEVTQPDPQTTCQTTAPGGTYSIVFTRWLCTFHFASFSDYDAARNTVRDTLLTACTTSLNVIATSDDSGAVTAVSRCAFPDIDAMNDACNEAVPGGFGFNDEEADCGEFDGTPPPSIIDRLTALCTDLGGVSGFLADDPLVYTCVAPSPPVGP